MGRSLPALPIRPPAVEGDHVVGRGVGRALSIKSLIIGARKSEVSVKMEMWRVDSTPLPTPHPNAPEKTTDQRTRILEAR